MNDKSTSILAKITTFANDETGLYTLIMSFFVKATSPQKPRTPDVIKVTRLYIVLISILVLCQLASFFSFVTVLEGFGFIGGHTFAHLLAAIIIVIELFALPFLLRVRLSPLARIISMACGWLVAVIWLFISLWLLSTVNAVTNIGLLGGIIALIPGWWCALLSIAFGLLAAWTSWGMWPRTDISKIKRKNA